MDPNWTENDILVAGKSVHYTRTGGAGKPPLILLHGFSDNGMCWLPVARDLEAEFDLILPDAHGHGHSARIQPGEKIDRAGDVANLIRAMGLQHPLVGGHSMGASTAAQLEARFPGLARALILEDPAWFQRDPARAADAPARPNPFQDWLPRLADASVEQVMASCRKQNPSWAEVELRPWAESKKQFDLNIFTLQNDAHTGWEEVVNAIHCPSLLITADPQKGAIVSPELARQASLLNPQVRVVHLGGGGHNIRRESYPGYIAALRAFLAEQ